MPEETTVPEQAAAAGKDDSATVPTLADWIDDCQFDPVAKWFVPARRPCPDLSAIQKIMALYEPGVAHGSDPLDLLPAFIGASRRLAMRPDHSLCSRVQKMLAHFENEARYHLVGGLESLGARKVELVGEDHLRFARVALVEIYENVRAFLEEGGFLDTIPGPRKKVVVVHSRYRTGSTLVYNAVRVLLGTAGESVRSRGADWNEVDGLIQGFQEGAYSGRWLLLKSHNWFPKRDFDDVIPIFSRRNLADVAASSLGLWERNASVRTLANDKARHFNAVSLIREVEYQKLFNEFVVCGNRTNVIDYDSFIDNIEGLVSTLADLLGVSLTAKDICKVALAVDPEHTRARVNAMTDKVEGTTLLRRTHLGTSAGKVGGLRHTLPRFVRDRLKELGEWQFDPEPPHRNAFICFEDQLMTRRTWIDLVTLTFDEASNCAMVLVTQAGFIEKLRDFLFTLQEDTGEFVTGHQVVAGLIRQFAAIASGEKEYDEAKRDEIARHIDYHGGRLASLSPTPLSDLLGGIEMKEIGSDKLSEIEISIKELIEHCSNIIGYDLSEYEEKATTSRLDFSIIQSGGKDIFTHYLPENILSLKTRTRSAIIERWFFKSLQAIGDVCEFGCGDGAMSIKLATVLSALRVDNKKVYAFDTFGAVQISDDDIISDADADPLENAAFAELNKFSGFLPLAPVRGEPARTCLTLRRPLSFVWLDLDSADRLRPVLDGIWEHLGEDSIVAVVNIGRPETPSVATWVEELLVGKRLNQLIFYPDDRVGFYQPNSAWRRPE